MRIEPVESLGDFRYALSNEGASPEQQKPANLYFTHNEFPCLTHLRLPCLLRLGLDLA